MVKPLALAIFTAFASAQALAAATHFDDFTPLSSSFGTPEGPRCGGSECGFMIAAEGHTLYHSGDTDILADMEWFADYYKPDIGILSAGGHFTMDMAKAAYAAKRFFDFRIVIPGHYRTFPVLEQSAEALALALPGVKVIEPQVMQPIEV